jgi:hypothetical protein
MSTTSDREHPAAGHGPEPVPGRPGGVEGGAILVGVILAMGVVLMVLKLAGVLG